ncbi:membrane protein [Pararhizobium capsulatum DSM 1112]|uniref:Membrane protein n=1 Tax=Pararhizobium capsulatum DSM 1112 TaxID=1121113 RepID=A0ABU0BWL7_9HYPH|nr:YihY/virulence factor BrkB family protein [Pararhizobium capsulatum]MDQ0322074.1 membrane protein [Pararhizobium capsulatum DSM 1112]
MFERKQVGTIATLAVAAIAAVVIIEVANSRVTNRSISARILSSGKDKDKASVDEHGRFADVPEDIPGRGLRDVLWRVFHEVSEDRVTLIAGGVTFYLLLALFPGVAALVSLYGLMADPVTISEHLRDLASVLPTGTFEVFSEQIESVVRRQDATLGITFLVGLGIALWSTHNGTLAVFDAMNVAYEEDEKRSFVRRNLVALCFTVCAMIAATILVGLFAVMPVVMSYIWLAEWEEQLALLLRWPVLLMAVFVASTAVYRFGPSRQPAKLRWLTWGAVLATVGWTAMTWGFSWYLDTVADYNATYGTLGGLVGFLVWIWLSVAILIMGGELNAELEHQTSKDTTTGLPLPMGSRGAQVADTLGKQAP